MGLYSDIIECDKCGYSDATWREESSYAVYSCPLCCWKSFDGDVRAARNDEGRAHNPTKKEINRAKKYILYIEISQLNSMDIFDYDLVSYVDNEIEFMKKLLETVFIKEE